MAKEVEKPKEELAPAYFVQYSALWCIMLGFFVLLLSLGEAQSGTGDAGVGHVRDVFGSGGGLGMLPFSKNAFRKEHSKSASLRVIRSEQQPPSYSVEGFVRGMLTKKGLSDLSLWMIEESPDTSRVVIGLPVEFRDDQHLTIESIRMLELLSEILFHLSGHQFDCMMYLEEPGANPEQLLKRSMLRSAVVARFLSDACALPSGSIRSVGFYDKYFIASYGIENVSGKVLLSIQ